jgi:hypothetical protein
MDVSPQLPYQHLDFSVIVDRHMRHASPKLTQQHLEFFVLVDDVGANRCVIDVHAEHNTRRRLAPNNGMRFGLTTLSAALAEG